MGNIFEGPRKMNEQQQIINNIKLTLVYYRLIHIVAVLELTQHWKAINFQFNNEV